MLTKRIVHQVSGTALLIIAAVNASVEGLISLKYLNWHSFESQMLPVYFPLFIGVVCFLSTPGKNDKIFATSTSESGDQAPEMIGAKTPPAE